jgi:hypothetical protein
MDETPAYDRKKREQERDEAPARPLRPEATDPRGGEPHHPLANPAGEPDPTEWPDPYERAPDPRDPATADTPASPADRERTGSEHDQTPRAPSTSEPHPPRNYDDVKPEKGG